VIFLRILTRRDKNSPYLTAFTYGRRHLSNASYDVVKIAARALVSTFADERKTLTKRLLEGRLVGRRSSVRGLSEEQNSVMESVVYVWCAVTVLR